MKIIRSNSRKVLILIIIIQFLVIGTFAYSDNITSVTTTKNITAIIEEENDRYLLIQGFTEPRLFNIDENARYINHENNNIHLFNNKQEYILTMQFNPKLTTYTEVKLEGIEYQSTNFSCKRSICLISQENDAGTRLNTQLFSVKNQEYIYLDADSL